MPVAMAASIAVAISIAVSLASGSIASAQTAAPTPPATPTPPLTGAAGQASATQPAPPAPPATAAAPAPVAPVAPGAPSDARATCAAAMNADPTFAAAIIKTADENAAKQRDADLLAANLAAEQHVQKNERHVLYAYAAIWIVAALFVVFLWRRQQALKAEISALRHDLELAGNATAKERT